MKWIDLENYKFPEGITLNRNTVNNSLTFKMVDTSKGCTPGTCIFPETGKLCISLKTPCSNVEEGFYPHFVEFNSLEELTEDLINAKCNEALTCPIKLNGGIHQ